MIAILFCCVSKDEKMRQLDMGEFFLSKKENKQQTFSISLTSLHHKQRNPPHLTMSMREAEPSIQWNQ
jgi:hypothetical protein